MINSHRYFPFEHTQKAMDRLRSQPALTGFTEKEEGETHAPRYRHSVRALVQFLVVQTLPGCCKKKNSSFLFLNTKTTDHFTAHDCWKYATLFIVGLVQTYLEIWRQSRKRYRVVCVTPVDFTTPLLHGAFAVLCRREMRPVDAALCHVGEGGVLER